MTTVNASEARTKLYSLSDKVAERHRPVLTTGKRGNAVLVAEEDAHMEPLDDHRYGTT